MNALPIMQRYAWMAMYLMPGVTSMNGFHIAGQRDRGLGYTMDGIAGTEPIRGGVATNRIMSTTQNAIEEVKMVTTVLPAENGHSAGGMISITYKSGTQSAPLRGRGPLHQQSAAAPRLLQSGAPHGPVQLPRTVGAWSADRSYLPKLYNGRNKTFFLFGWSRHHEKYNQQVFADVPTPEMLNGDFSFSGLGYPDLRSCDYDAGCQRQLGARRRSRQYHSEEPFRPRRGQVPQQHALERSQQSGRRRDHHRTGPQLNYGAQSIYRSYRTRYDVKIDHNFSEKNRLFGRFSHVRNRAFGTNIAVNWRLLDGTSVLQPSDQINVVISDTHMFSPTVINEIRLGANHRKESRDAFGLNENWGQQLGIPGISPETFPSFFNSAGGAFYGASMPRRHFL